MRCIDHLPLYGNRRETQGRIITCHDVSSMISPSVEIKATTPETVGEDGADKYGVKEQFTWMLARESLERGTTESRWSPISCSDSSISRPTPLISASSLTTVLRHTRNIHEQIYRIAWPQDNRPKCFSRELTWRLGRDTPGRDIAMSDLELPRSQKYGFYR